MFLSAYASVAPPIPVPTIIRSATLPVISELSAETLLGPSFMRIPLTA